MDAWLAEVQEDDVSRRLAVERQHRLAALLADTRTRIARLVGSVAAGALLSQGVAARVVGQLLARVSITVRDIHLRVLGDAGDGQGTAPEFVLGVVCKLVSLGAGPPDTAAGGSCDRDRTKLLVLDGLSVYWHKAAGAHAASRQAEKSDATAPVDALVLVQPVVMQASMRVTRGEQEQAAAGHAASWVLTDVQARLGAISVRTDPEAIRDMSHLFRGPLTDESRPPLLPQRSSGIVRPSVGYKKAAVWLQYASACIACRSRRERLALHPQALARRVKDLKRYRLLYASHLSSSLALFLGEEQREAVSDEVHAGGDAAHVGGQASGLGQASGAAADSASVDTMDELADLESGLPLTAIMALRDSCQAHLAVSPRKSFPPASSLSSRPPDTGDMVAAGPGGELPREPLGYWWWLGDFLLPWRHSARARANASTADLRHAAASLEFLFCGPPGEVLNADAHKSLRVSFELAKCCVELCGGRTKTAALSGGSGPSCSDVVARIHVCTPFLTSRPCLRLL